jgi:DNA-binding winged helix-turn-helix (wHTH) protein
MPNHPTPPAISFGRYTFDRATHQLTCDQLPVHLTPKAFDLLSLLIAEAPRVVQKEDLHRHLWPDSFVSDASLLGLIKEVRRALGDEGDGTVIRTVHRVGYAFAAPLQPVAAPAARAGAWVMAGSVLVPLHEGENLIGRDAGCTVCLDLPNISRRHARIVVSGPDATVEDLGSTNGTLLGAEKLVEAKPLREADRIQLGDAVLTFHFSPNVAPKVTLPTAEPGQ